MPLCLARDESGRAISREHLPLLLPLRSARPTEMHVCVYVHACVYVCECVRVCDCNCDCVSLCAGGGGIILDKITRDHEFQKGCNL